MPRRRAASRINLAQDAYGNLAARAWGHRHLQRLILILAIAFTGLAVWESAKVAFGKALLQNLDLLRAEQTLLNAEKVKLEMSLGPPAAAQTELMKWVEEHRQQIINPFLMVHGTPRFSLCTRRADDVR